MSTRRCRICGAVEYSSIHAVTSLNREIQKAAHQFVPSRGESYAWLADEIIDKVLSTPGDPHDSIEAILRRAVCGSCGRAKSYHFKGDGCSESERL
jgi:hypothetical protein